MYSASSLRKNIDNDDSIKTLFDFENIYKEKYKVTYPISEDDFDTIMATKLIENLHSNVDLSIYNNIDEQLANKIIKTLRNNSYSGWNDFCMMLKSKNIAYTSISRGLLSILLDIKKDDFKKYLDNNICNFVRILGFNKASSNILNSIKNNSSLTLIGQLSEINDNLDLNEIDLNMINKSILADEFYNSIVKLKYSTDIPNEYKRKLIIKS
jgi:predicted nucleotidyltransferase